MQLISLTDAQPPTHRGGRAAVGLLLALTVGAWSSGRAALADDAFLPSVIPEERWAALMQPAPQPETIPAPGGQSPILDPGQPDNLRRGAGESFLGRTDATRTVLDPNQVGNIDKRLSAIEGEKLPLIRLSGFFQLDDGLFSQDAFSQARIGDAFDGVSFRRTRLQAIGKLTEFTNYSIEMDFAFPGRPSFMDVWGEQEQIPFFGTVRIGQFRQPGTMDSWTSIRHLEFLERSAPFSASDPFRRVGIMAYSMSDDERTSWAYSMYATGLTFWNGTGTVYSTIGDNRNGTQIGDNSGVSFSSRITHLLYYDEPSEGRYLLHVGGGYGYSGLGGEGKTGPFARTFRSAIFPEFYIGDQAGVGLTGAGTPLVMDTGRFLANSFNLYHLELAGASGPAHFQSEVLFETINQLDGPVVFQPAAYVQCGYMLTGEAIGYLKQAGVFDYNVVPFTPFFGTGRHGRIRGWGAWELAARWSYVDLSGVNIRPSNILPGPPDAVPPSPNAGVLNETTVGVNWWWNRFTRVQFNWIHSMPNYIGYGAAPFDIFGSRFQIEF
jgi:phosphate-selective porin OprO/OprP